MNPTARPSPSPAASTSAARRVAAHRHDEGQVGGVEVLPFAVLIFVVGSLLLANAWAVIDAKMAASAAAREAARAYAEVPAEADRAAAWARAEAAADEAFRSYDIPAARTFVHPSQDPGAVRCARAVVVARVTVPAIVLPWIGGFGQGLVVRARHSELVDPYRSGLQGEACG